MREITALSRTAIQRLLTKSPLAQFIKAVHVKRGHELDIAFNVSFEEFQSLYLEPEEKSRKRKGTMEILTLTEYKG